MNRLDLSETYRHLDVLLWQQPSAGVAIAGGAVLVCNQIGNGQESAWPIDRNYVQASVLLLAGVLVSALAVAVYKYRMTQTAAAPHPAPKPPFDQPPQANAWLQAALCLTAAGLFGLMFAVLFHEAVGVPILLGLGVLTCFFVECNAKRVKSQIIRDRELARGAQRADQRGR